MLEDLISQRQSLHDQVSQRRARLGVQAVGDEQIAQWKHKISEISSQIRDINRATAHDNAVMELPALIEGAHALQWVHGHAFEGVPFAGRAVVGAFIINHTCAKTRRGDRWNVQLYLNHRHMSQQMGALRRTVALQDQVAYRVDEVEYVLAQMLQEVCRRWLGRHKQLETDPSTVSSSS